MEIYKRGQGTWARGFAIAMFVMFAGWGVYEVYRLPGRLNIIVKPGDVIWPETARRLIRADKATVRVKGLANQRVGPDLMRPGLRPARRIETPDGHGLVLETEDLNDREKIQAIENAKIRHVPVTNAENALLDSVEITDWLLGRRLAEEVSDPDMKVFEDTAADMKLDAALVARIRKELEPFPEALVGPLWRTEDAREKKLPPEPVPLAEVAEGMVCAEKLTVPVVRRVGTKDQEVTPEVLDALRKLEAKTQGRFKKVKILDEGLIRIDPEKVDEIGSRYLTAEDTKTIDTFWNRTLVEALGVRITPGILISAALMIAAALFLVWTWNWPRWNDLLIDTQTEMRKVSWPKRSELFGSSLIVIMTVVVMGLFLYVVDFLLTALAMKVGLLR